MLISGESPAEPADSLKVENTERGAGMAPIPGVATGRCPLQPLLRKSSDFPRYFCPTIVSNGSQRRDSSTGSRR
jgi:hypothetical protein